MYSSSVLSCTASVWSHNMKIDVIAVLSVCFLHKWPPGHASVYLFFCSVMFFPCTPIATLPCSLAPCQFMCCLFPPCSLSFLRSLCSFSLSLSTALLPLSPTATQAWFTSTTWWREGLLSATSSSHMVLCPGWLTNLQSLLLPYFPSMWKQQQWRKKQFESGVLYRVASSLVPLFFLI